MCGWRICQSSQQASTVMPAGMGIGSSDGEAANTILRVIVDNMLYPVSLETLHMVRFCRMSSIAVSSESYLGQKIHVY